MDELKSVVPKEWNQEDTVDAEVQHQKVVKELIAMTLDDLKLFQDSVENRRDRSLFIEKLEFTPIRVAINNWLSNLKAGTRRSYGYYINDMMRRNIIPEKDGSGKLFTVGHFRQIPHELCLDYIKKIQG